MKALVEMENSGLVPMLRDDKFDDLGRMYQLLRKVDGGANLIRSVMSDYVKEIGKQLVQDPEKCKVRLPSAYWPMHAVDEFSVQIPESTHPAHKQNDPLCSLVPCRIPSSLCRSSSMSVRSTSAL